MRRTFCFKLYSSKRNRYLHQRIEIAAEIYNHCITFHRRYYRLFKKYLNRYALQKYLTKLKKRKRFEHWSEVGSQAIQDITDRIDKGFSLFFRGLRKRLRFLRQALGKGKNIVRSP